MSWVVPSNTGAPGQFLLGVGKGWGNSKHSSGKLARRVFHRPSPRLFSIGAVAPFPFWHFQARSSSERGIASGISGKRLRPASERHYRVDVYHPRAIFAGFQSRKMNRGMYTRGVGGTGRQEILGRLFECVPPVTSEIRSWSARCFIDIRTCPDVSPVTLDTRTSDRLSLFLFTAGGRR